MKTTLFLLVVLVTNAIQAITGFAGTLLAMPPSILLIGVTDAKVILNFLALVTCLAIVLRNKNDVQWKILGKILFFMAIGMGIGVWLFLLVQTEFLLYAYGVMIILIALKNMVIKKEMRMSAALTVVILLAAGVIHGMFVSGGALLVVYASFVLKDKNKFRATVAAVWVCLNSVLMIQQVAAGLVDVQLTTLAAASCIPAFLGVIIGSKMHAKISQSMFMKLTYVLLLISGILCFF